VLFGRRCAGAIHFRLRISACTARADERGLTDVRATRPSSRWLQAVAATTTLREPIRFGGAADLLARLQALAAAYALIAWRPKTST